MNGYLYVLSNLSMPGLLKIGCTDREIAERVAELNSATGVPTTFKVEAVFFCVDSFADESTVHSALEEFRIEGKEFFRIELVKALESISRILNRQPWHLIDLPAEPDPCNDAT